jgi:hypothetical protein
VIGHAHTTEAIPECIRGGGTAGIRPGPNRVALELKGSNQLRRDACLAAAYEGLGYTSTAIER